MTQGDGGRGGQLDPSEDGYLASVGDLMSAVLFVFIITVVVFAVALAKQEEKVTSVVRNVRESRDSLIVRVASSLLESHVQVSIDLEQGVIRLPERVVFQQGDAALGVAESSNVALLARVLNGVLPAYCKGGGSAQQLEALFIEGHADSVAIHNYRYRDNLELSAARAHTVYMALIASVPTLGMLRNAESNFLFSASGYGDTRPWASNATPEGQQKNRRIDLRFVMATPKMPAPAVETQAKMNR